jgi:hypothetical protein
MYDLDQFSEEPVDFTVEHQGKTLTFYAKAASLDEFLTNAKHNARSTDTKANMRRTLQELLLDDEQKPVTKEWVDKLFGKPNLVPLGIKINAALNSALGLDEIAGKKA